MFAKLKKKIQEEAQNVVSTQEDWRPSKTAGPGLASPVSKDYPRDGSPSSPLSRGGPFFSPKQKSETSEISSDGMQGPERNGSRASSEENNDGASKEEVLSMLMKRTEQVKKLESKISDFASMLKEKNRQIDKLENSLEKQKEESEAQVKALTEKYNVLKVKVAQGFAEAVNGKEHSRAELQERLDKAEIFRDKYYSATEDTEEMTNLTTVEMAKVKHILLNTQSELMTSTQSLQESEEKVRTLKEEISSLMKQVIETNNKSDEFEESNKVLKEKLKLSELSHEKLEKQLDNLQKNASDFGDIYKNYSELQAKHEVMVSEMEISKNKLKTELDRKLEQVSHLQEKINILEIRLNQSQLSDNEQLQASATERSALETRLSETREQLTQLKSSTAETITILEQKVLHLNSKASEHNLELHKKQRVMDDLQISMQKEIDSWKSKLQMALLELKDKEKLLDAQRASHELELSRRQKSALLLEEELNEQIRQLKSQLDTVERTRERDKQAALDRIAKLESGQQDWLEREIDAERQITQIEDDLHKCKVEISEKDKEIIILRRQLKQKEQELLDKESKFKLNVEQVREHGVNSEKLEQTISSLRKELQSCHKEKDDLMLRNAQLSQEFEGVKRETASELRDLLDDVKQRDSAIAGLEESLIDLQREAKANQEKISQLEADHGAALDKVESDEINHLKQEVSQMDSQLTDKNKTIKMLQQRVTDLKKTLQRELKVQALPNDEIAGGLSPATSSRDITQLVAEENSKVAASYSPPSIEITHQTDTRYSNHRKTSNSGAYSRPYPPNIRHSSIPQDVMNYSSHRNSKDVHVYYCDPKDFMHDLNFEYLKHVVLKFMLSREHEAVHLIKAVAMLLHFSPDEQRLIKDTLDYKMSWFGTRPHLGTGQMAKVIPSTY